MTEPSKRYDFAGYKNPPHISKYHIEWHAKCSACKRLISYEDYTCTMCLKGKIKGRKIYLFKTEIIQFGCDIDDCAFAHFYVRCKCGETLILKKQKPATEPLQENNLAISF